jgi:hypothetical protein
MTLTQLLIFHIFIVYTNSQININPLVSRDTNQEKILILLRTSKNQPDSPGSSCFVRNNKGNKVIRDEIDCLQNYSKQLKRMHMLEL